MLKFGLFGSIQIAYLLLLKDPTTISAMEKTFCLVYASSASKNFSESELEGILKISRINNANLNVTGMLLYADGNFLQVLEGDKAQVEALYQKITEDTRHHSALRIFSRFSDSRNFAEWSMGYERLDASRLDQAVPGFNHFMERQEVSASEHQAISKAVWSLLTSFKQVVNV